MKRWKWRLLPMVLLCGLALLGGCSSESWVESTLGGITYGRAPVWEIHPVETAGGGDDSSESVALDLDLKEQTFIALFYYDGKKAPPGYETAQSYYRKKYGNPQAYREFQALEGKTVDGREALHVSFWAQPDEISPYYVEQYIFDSKDGLYIVSLSCGGENPTAIRLLDRVVDSVRFQTIAKKNL